MKTKTTDSTDPREATPESSPSHLALRAAEVLGYELFPMPLIAMEKFMFWDESADYPKVFRVGLVFAGEIDDARLEMAFRIAIQRQPLLCASIDDSGNTLQWFIANQVAIPFHRTGDFERSPFIEPIDIRREPGIRFWYQSAFEQSELVLEFHHSACDGIGARVLLRDWLHAYIELHRCGTIENEFMPLDPARLQTRGMYKRVVRTESTRTTSTWEKLVHAYHFHFRGPQPIRLVDRNGRDRFEHRRLQLNPQQSEAMVEIARENDCSVNDLMVGLCVEAISRWNSDAAVSRRWQRARILIPTSHRSAGELKLPSANRLGFGFVSLSRDQCESRQRILKETIQQLKMIQQLQLGLDFVDLFGVASQWEWPTRKVLGLHRCMATATLSNMGDLTDRFVRMWGKTGEQLRVGNLVLLGVYGVPPLRPLTRAGIGACKVNGQFCFAAQTESIPGFAESFFELLRGYVDPSA